MVPVEGNDEPKKKITQAQDIFISSKPEYQALIRDILKEERDVMYLKKRTEIHKNIYEHIKRIIK